MIKISTDIEKDKFNQFVSIEENARILFSGKFGTGKTHFLNEFFEVNKNTYEVFHLYPVNYQIGNNEDILNLIKYDIVVELIRKNKDVFQAKEVCGIKESSLLFWSWAKENFTINSFLQKTVSTGEDLLLLAADPFTTVLSKLGRPLKELLEIDKEFQEFKLKYKAGDAGLIDEFNKLVKNKDISEPDYISNLIKEKILSEKAGKKSILVLDDLDRIDPEHIFRLLNLLSAFFEREDKNRFGFDCIIIVADYSNLENIFHHKYGPETDFSGYVNKFFSITPYYFDNRKAVISTVESVVLSVKNENPSLKTAIEHNNGYIKLFLEQIFSRAVELDLINLRELLKPTRFQFTELRKGGFNENDRGDSFQKIFDIGIKIAILSFANKNTFLGVVNKIKKAKFRTKEIMPFKDYLTCLLKVMNVVPSQGGKFYYNSYEVTWNFSTDSFESVSRGVEKDLFYDLLTEYVESKGYFT
jgi:hypothetical protein